MTKLPGTLLIVLAFLPVSAALANPLKCGDLFHEAGDHNEAKPYGASVLEGNAVHDEAPAQNKIAGHDATAVRARTSVDSNHSARLQYIRDYNFGPKQTFAEEIPQLNTVRVKLLPQFAPTLGSTNQPGFYFIFFHGAGTDRAGPHSATQNLIDFCSTATPEDPSSTQAKIRALKNYRAVGGESVALPGSKAGPARSDYQSDSNLPVEDKVAVFIRDYVALVRSELPPGTRIIAVPRSSSPSLIVYAELKYPGLFDGNYLMSPNPAGTGPLHEARISEGTQALIDDLIKQKRQNVLDVAGTTWIDDLLTKYDWTAEDFRDRLPPTAIETGWLDSQVLRPEDGNPKKNERQMMIDLAAASNGNVTFFDHVDGEHNALETAADAPRSLFDLVARVDGDRTREIQAAADLATFTNTMHSGIGVRGYMGPYPARTVDNLVASLPLGVMEWKFIVKLVKNLEEARAVHAWDVLQKNPIHQPVYMTIRHPVSQMIASNLAKFSTWTQSNLQAMADNAKLLEGDPNKKPKEYFLERIATIESNALGIVRESSKIAAMMKKELADQPEFYTLNEQGEPSYLSPEQIKHFIAPEEFSIGWEKNGALGVLKADGPTYPKLRGVIVIEEAVKTGAFKSGLKNLKKFESLYEFRRNTNFFGVMDALYNQKRRGKSEGSNRYRGKETWKQTQLAYQQGLVETEETYNKHTGLLVGGTIAFKLRGTSSFDAPFYPESGTATEGIDGIDFQRMILAKSIENLREKGIKVADVQMVTNLTAQFGARYVPSSEFEAMTTP